MGKFFVCNSVDLPIFFQVYSFIKVTSEPVSNWNLIFLLFTCTFSKLLFISVFFVLDELTIFFISVPLLFFGFLQCVSLWTFWPQLKHSFLLNGDFLIIMYLFTAITRIYFTGKLYFKSFLFNCIYFWHVILFNPRCVVSRIFSSFVYHCDNL